MANFKKMPLLPHSDSAHGGRFVYSTAHDVKSAFDTAAQRIESQAGSRASYAATAAQDFSGHFTELFAQNCAPAKNDATNLATALRAVTTYIAQMVTAGEAEDRRRTENNEWVRRHNNPDLWEQFCNCWGGEPPAPNMDPGPAPTFPAVDVNRGHRHSSDAGTGGSTGGRSSARPDKLRTFAQGSRSLDSALSSQAGSLQGKLDDFTQDCYWGRIDAQGVVTAYAST